MYSHPARSRGVTLIELLIVMVIIGILTTVAYPAYTEQAAQGRRAAAKSMLNQVMQRQEQWYSMQNSYTLNLSDLGYGAGPTYYTENNTHTVTLAAGATGDIATSVQVSAAPAVGDTKCGTLALTSTLARSATGTQPAICW